MNWNERDARSLRDARAVLVKARAPFAAQYDRLTATIDALDDVPEPRQEPVKGQLEGDAHG